MSKPSINLKTEPLADKNDLFYVQAAKILSHSTFFQDLPQEIILKLARASMPKNYERGQIVFNQGDKAEGFHLVSAGLIKIFLLENSGKERILRLCGPLSLFGEAAIFTPGGYPAWAEAVKKSSTLIVPSLELKKLIGSSPDLALTVIGALASRVNHFKDIIESSLKNLLPKVADYLLKLPNDGSIIKLAVTKTQLALTLGITPESLSRAFKRLKHDDLIEEAKPGLIIKNRAALSRLAQGERD
ncbi:MAG: Crp/Fnr family transcriptional regulator [Deltaproteobacteria bacterium]|jgi:CRP/FNR family transcriptional regulator|nr:Crp/Fnr family transcriptional regulator [Deltaproteobacteria bacterium]